MKLLISTILLLCSFCLPLTAQNKHLWIKLSAEVQNLQHNLRIIGDDAAPDASALGVYLDKVDKTLDQLVNTGELQAHTVTFKTPDADKMQQFYTSSIVPLKSAIDTLGNKYGIYTAREMCGMGARLRIVIVKPNSTFKMRIRLPKEEMLSYLKQLKKLGLIDSIPDLTAKSNNMGPTVSYDHDSHWFSVVHFAKRAELIIHALETADKYNHLPYKFGSADPKNGGFDCSGATSYVMKKAGLKPPRTSAQQFIWIRDAGKIHLVGKKVSSLKNSSFNALMPGDLLFWSGTYTPTDGRTVKISHVGIYLGTEKDGRPIMACATNGRSYRGKKGNGYGIYDFKLPRKSSKAIFVGYGPPM